MSFIGKNPKWNTGGFTPQSTEPANPVEGMVYYDDGTNRAEGLYVYKDSQWTEVGSGSSGINYITNGDAEAGTVGWTAYDDGAAAAPVDGTGGTGTGLTFSASSSSPLRGVSSFLFQKDASDRQGKGISFTTFTIDPADRAKVLRISFDYVSSSAYADGDMRVYVHDITNSKLIEVVDRDINANEQGKYIGEFQTSADSTSYRLILHISSTNASAYDLKFDNLIVGPREIARGSVVTDWEEYTPVWSNTSSSPSIGNGVLEGRYRRIGDSVQVYIRLEYGSTTSGGTGTIWFFGLPPGLTVDNSKIGTQAAAPDYSHVAGTGSTFDDTAGSKGFNVVYDLSPSGSPSLSQGVFLNISDSAVNVNNTVPFTWTNPDSMEFTFQLPIQGWSANSEISTDFGSRVVAFKAFLSGTQNISSSTETTVAFDSVSFDTTNSFDTSTGIFTVPESGIYKFDCSIYDSAFSENFLRVRLKVNGSTEQQVETASEDAQIHSLSFAPIKVSKGDQVSITVDSVSDSSYDIIHTSINTVFGGFKIQSPQTLIGSESVFVDAAGNSGQVVAGGSGNIQFIKITDSHNAWNGFGFTAPISGRYSFDGFVFCTTAASRELRAYLNGSSYRRVGQLKNAQDYDFNFSIDLEKGDAVNIRFGSTGATLSNSTAFHYLTINKLK